VKRVGLNLLGIILVVLAAGCNQPTAAPPPAKAGASPGKAQPRLPTVVLRLGDQELVTEIARTAKQIETGMMWRTGMGEMEGMIFVFERPHRASFWMKNTLVPLSCAYIDPEGVILEIHDMRPKDEASIPAGTDRVQYVLEVPQGWFQRHNVPVGSLIRSERGTLRETFFRRP
jgi:uncharacterized protein